MFERYILMLFQNLCFCDGDCLGLRTRHTVIKLAMTNCSRNTSGILLSTTYLQEFFPIPKIRQKTGITPPQIVLVAPNVSLEHAVMVIVSQHACRAH